MPNLIGTAVATDGSVSNVAGIAGGGMQSGFVQWDVAHWAFNGSGIYEGKPKVDVLRAIANLYPESFHVVARKDSGIKTIRDLKGKRVSLDEGSGIAKLLQEEEIEVAGLAQSVSIHKALPSRPNLASETD